MVNFYYSAESYVIYYAVALVTYLYFRPKWKCIGPSLIDSYTIGIALYGVGAISYYYFTNAQYSFEVLRIATLAGTGAAVGSAIWAFLLRSQVEQLHFEETASNLRIKQADSFAITVGLSLSIVVCLGFLVALFLNSEIRNLLLTTLSGGSTYNDARITITSGSAGYLSVGYVKQFRDILIPILIAVALIARGPYRRAGLIYLGLFVVLLSMFVSGQRLVVIELLVCVVAAYVIGARFGTATKVISMPAAAAILLVLVAQTGLMTQMLNRAEFRHVPTEFLTSNTHEKTIVPSDVNIATESENTTSRAETTTNTTLETPKEHPSTAQTPALLSLVLNSGVRTLMSLADRSLMAVPRENVGRYSQWGYYAPTFGRGWLAELAGVLPGRQNQLSNQLATTPGSTGKGNSPLGLASNLYYNWGTWGTLLVAALYPLLFLLMDIHLTRSGSALLYAGKIYLFVAIPIMYSPYGFVLYGGAVVLAMMLYIFLVEQGAFNIIGVSKKE